MAFKYVAYNVDRQLIRGSIDVSTESVAIEIMRQSGYNVLSLSPAGRKLNIRSQIPALFGVKSKDVISFSRMLATLAERGTNTLMALELLRDQVSNVTFAEIIQEVSDDIRRGVTLADAMSRHPEAFPAIYCRTIKVSEQTGNLVLALRNVADHMEKQNAVVSKVGKSLAYPAFVFLVGCGVITLLIMVTLPALSDLFSDLGGDLPLPTKMMMSLTDFLGNYFLVIMGVVLGVVVMAALALKNPALRTRLDMALLRAPLIGPVITMREMVNFSRTLSTGLSTSIPMPDTLGLAVQTARNRTVADTLEKVRDEVLKGRGLAQILNEFSVFPRPLVQMVKVGEEASTLDNDLKTISDMYEAEVDTKVNTMVSILGPGVMLFLGVFVAFIAVSMIMPIYSFLGQIE